MDISYASLAERSWRLAGALSELGFRQGDRVAVDLPNIPEVLETWFALAHLGAVMVPLNPALLPVEVQPLLRHVDVRGLISDCERLDQLAAGLSLRARILVGGGEVRDSILFQDLLASGAPPPQARVSGSDLSTILQTSGTTGATKAAALSHLSYILPAREFVRWMQVTPEDRMLGCLPLFHMAGQAFAVSSLAGGATLVLVDRFSASRFWQQIRENRITLVRHLGEFLAALCHQPESSDDRDHGLRAVYGGGARPEVAEEFHRRFGAVVVEGYGLTETNTVLRNSLLESRRGSIGRPLPYGDVRIADEQGHALPASMLGEIQVRRNPVLMAGYVDRPDLTRDAFDGEWFRTGDLGYQDADGWFYFAGRKKEIIRRRGENIAPAPIEEILNRHPAVAASAVVGVADELGGEELKAYLLPRTGCRIALVDLIAWCGASLAEFKIPRYFEICDHLPFTPTHKINKGELRALGTLGWPCYDRRNERWLMEVGATGDAAVPPATVVELLRRRASEHGERRLYTWVSEAGEEGLLTYAELERRASGVAALLQREGLAGERALLLYPPGLDFIVAFFGCLLAGVVAVPAYPPGSRRTLPRVLSIVRDARPAAVLTDSSLLPRLRSLTAGEPGIGALHWLATDELPEVLAAGWQDPQVGPETTAFLQYTSGSTSTPKGVVVRHRNLLHNEEMICRAFGQSKASVVVGWLPLYHDMGLIGNVLQPLYNGATCVLMAPMTFLQRPGFWLETICRYGGTTSGGPNFAYELCARKMTQQEKAGLDLSGWRVAFSGAEPVRAETLERFAAAFAGQGFRREAFYPCYGLAEATLFVSGGAVETAPVVGRFDAEALKRHRIAAKGDRPGRELVGCGQSRMGQVVVIVNPESLRRCADDEVGEIWVSGPSVAGGYWDQPEATERDFQARLTGQPEAGPWLRTGDLGFFGNGELYVTGRLKDLIILRGRNHYPQDLEATAETSHPALRPGNGAAFAVERDREERLVVAWEVDGQPGAEGAAIAEAVRRAVAETHEVAVHEVVLLRSGTLPRTTSGKVRRRACAAGYLDSSLVIVGRSGVADGQAEDPASAAVEDLTREELLALPEAVRLAALLPWLQWEAARAARVAVEQMQLLEPLPRLGLDSLGAVELKGAIEKRLGMEIQLIELLHGCSLTDLAGQIAARLPLDPGIDLAGGTAARPARAGDQPLSAGQRALWFLERLAPEAGLYNIAMAFRARDDLDADALQRALSRLAERHPVLRATFHEVDGEPVQRVGEAAAIDQATLDAVDWTDADCAERLGVEACRPFDLATGPLLRLRLFTCAAAERVLLLVVHHLVSDFWSLAVLARELAAVYREETGGTPALLETLPACYDDFVARQEEMLAGPRGERLWEYWRGRLAGPPPALDLPTDRSRPALQTWRGGARALRFSQGLLDELQGLARAQDATLFTVLLAVWQVQLGRWTHQEDFAIGSPTAGRGSAEAAGVMGYFVNPVTLRAGLAGDPELPELLARTRDTVLGALEHADFPFPVLAERLQPVRDPARSPLFQAMFVLQTAQPGVPAQLAAAALGEAGVRIDLGSTFLTSARIDERRVQFDLGLRLAPLAGPAGGLGAVLEYNADLFNATTAGRMLEQLHTLLRSAVAEPARRISGLPLLAPEERHQVLVEWRATPAVEAPFGSIVEAFEAQARSRPEAEALVCGELRLTYEELNRRANRLAGILESLGVGPEVRVGLCAGRSPNLVVGLLAILKAGGAYVPIDPAYPEERRDFMLADSGASVLLAEKHLLPRHHSGLRAIELGAPEAGTSRSDEDLAVKPRPRDLAYLIYTSGSTGRPKAVLVEHGSLLNTLMAAQRAFAFEPGDRMPAIAPFSFDIFLFELLSPLLAGGTSVLLPLQPTLDLSRLVAELHRSTRFHAVPAVMRQVLDLLQEQGDTPPPLREVYVGGDTVPARLLADLRRALPAVRVQILYGPTEGTIFCSRFTVPEDAEDPSPLIGRPIAGVSLGLYDLQGSPVPMGVPGEIHLGGAAVTRGYLDRPELTAEKFVPASGGRLYRTGDLARHLPDGQLEFLGRADRQVKIRGFRIELGEVESVLGEHAGVREAVVAVRDLAEGPTLVAYVVLHPTDWPDPIDPQSVLAAWLSDRLPRYMVPSAFVRLDALPLSATGKVDRRALPAPELRATVAGARTARTPTEEIVAGIWAEVLGIQQVDREADFFALGGHSLLAARVVSRLRAALGVEVPLAHLFESPVVMDLAARVDRLLAAGGTPAAPPLRRAPRDGALPLSFSQEGIWFREQLQPGASAYNMVQALALHGDLDVQRLAAALREVMRRHEILRTTFGVVHGHPVQVIAPMDDRRLPLVDLRALPDAARAAEARSIVSAEAERPFDLARGPLLRTMALRTGASGHMLIFALHHLVADGWSIGVLAREISALYAAAARGEVSPLPALPVQYADFAAWQRAWLQGEVLELHLRQWRERLAGVPPLELPADRPRPPVPSFRGAGVLFALADGVAQDLRSLGRRHGVTLFMLLLAGFSALLRRHTGQTDLLVGVPAANRSRPETEPLIGLFVNLQLLRQDLSGEPRIADLLSRVRRRVLDAHAGQDLPFELLADDLRAAGQGSLPQVVCQLLAPLTSGLDLLGLTAEPLPQDIRTAKFDLVLNATQSAAKGLELTCLYSTDLFDAATVLRMTGHLTSLLAGLAAGPDRLVADLPLLGPAEEQQVVVEWNPPRPLKRSLEPPVHELVTAQARRTPDAVSLSFGESCITYAELERRANQLAHRLRALGVGPEVRVGICMERSPEVVIGLLGILKAGGAYVPLDPSYPQERLAFMIEDGRVSVLVTQPHLRHVLPPADLAIVDLDAGWSGLRDGSAEEPPYCVVPENLAYVMYTSGSTGRPKGVSIPHSAVTWFVETLSYVTPRPEDRIVQGSTHSFDAATFEVWGALTYGARLIVLPKEVMIAPRELAARLREEGATVLYLTAALFAQTVAQAPDAFQPLRQVLTSGEVVGVEFFRHLVEGTPPEQVLHLYGPTETTVFSCWDEVVHVPAGAATVSIGRPIERTKHYLLDAALRPVPAGVFGELYIGGDGLARDYLNRPELTAAKFVPSPFSGGHDEPGARLYRSGDLVRYLPDGRMEFGGRIDTQVKIRGYRVEPQEIETKLVRHFAIQEAVVILREDTPGDKRLVAYLVLRDGSATIDLRELRAFLKEDLPDYMVPAAFVPLAALPISNNGKMDRRALPAPDARAGVSGDFVAPQSPLELWLAGLWQEVLGVAAAGLDDNFFELGGNSLTGAVLINRLQEEVREIIHVVVIFDAPTLREQAAYLVREHRRAVERLWGAASLGEEAGAAERPAQPLRVGPAELAQIRRLVRPLAPAVLQGKNPPTVFVLSPPRSGSTLLRVMLGGHPRLFAPPELELLSFNTLAERKAAYPGRDAFWLEGALRAVMEARRCGAAEAQRIVAEMEDEGATSQRLYRSLQEWIGDRVLVDKTPSYALDLAVLRRAEEMFDGARYLHLVRHPNAMIRSFEEAKLDQLFFRYEHPFVRRELAELIWSLSQKNILELLSGVPASRQLRVHFEELVREPERVLAEICSFLGLDYRPEMADPYQDKAARMIDGIHAESRMLGDVKFQEHGRVQASVADRWRSELAEESLGDPARELAAVLGYAPRKAEEWSRIEPRDRRPGAAPPLSFAQQRLWFLDRLEPGSPAYNVPAAVRMRGPLDAAVLRRSLGAIVQRHEALRTAFPEVAGEAVQVVAPALDLDLPTVDLRGLPPAVRTGEARRLARAEARRPFDLARGPLVRGTLVAIDCEEHAVLLSMHHIVSDGWSIGVLMRELEQIYGAFLAGRPSPLPELSIQYADYARWQLERFQGDLLRGELAFWRQRLGTAPLTLDLPTDRPRPAVQTVRGTVERAVLPPALADDLQRLARGRGATLFMALLAGFQALLARTSGQTDISVGSPVAGRNHVQTEQLIGFFVNTLVLRSDLSGDPSFAELLGRVRRTALDAFAHQELPFEKLVAELQPARGLDRTPLFQVVLVLQNARSAAAHLLGLEMTPLEVDASLAKFDLTLALTEGADGLAALLEYRTDLFDSATIRRFLGHFQTLLAAAVRSPLRPWAELPLLSEGELHQLTAEQEAGPAPRDGRTLPHHLFAAQAARRPGAVAVTCEGNRLTYGELDALAGALARRLRSLGVGPETRVGLCVERSLAMVAGILGILKAGGAYVPLDPAYPEERLRYLLDDSGMQVLVTQAHLRERLPAGDLAVVELGAGGEPEDGEPPAAGRPDPETGIEPDPDNLAYVIYTSGSTGRPKGVGVTHANVARLLAVSEDLFRFGPEDVWTLFHSHAFDFSVWEIWGALAFGGRLVVVPYWMSRSPADFDGLLRSERVTVLNQTPSAFRQLVEQDLAGPAVERALRWVIFGGEALPLASLRPWYARYGDQAPVLVNMYGITETTVHVTFRRLSAADLERAWASVIGRPLPDLSLHVLDRSLHPVPLGVAGEICVGGAGLARGYLGRPDLTAERFQPQPGASAPGARMYRSGDLARHLPGGDLEYLGRTDHQVKIRGFRIELGEIEAALSGHPGVRQALVLARRDGSAESRLVAYLIPCEAGAHPAVLDLRAYLHQRLPEHMVPAAFVFLAELPLTVHGKVDRAALPAPDAAEAQSAYAAPETAAEQSLARIWEEVLQIDRVGLDDNFFALGGDSILSIRIVARARDLGLGLTLQQIFQHQTVRELAGEISAVSPEAAEEIPPFGLLSEADRQRLPDGLEDAYPLARLQAGMLFHSELSPETSVYHDIFGVHLRMPFDAGSLQRAVDRMMALHPVLRTAFDMTSYSEPLQLIHRDVEAPLLVEDLCALDTPAQELWLADWIETERRQPFLWSTAPLVRFYVHRRSAETLQLSVSFHHAILDGWSLNALIAQLLRIYLALRRGEEPAVEEPTGSFRQLVEAETAALQSDESRAYLTRWTAEASIPILPRWLSGPVPEESRGSGGYRAALPPALSDRVQEVARRAGVPVKSALLAVHCVTIAALGGQEEAITGLVTHGRPEVPGGERILGLFLNTLPFYLPLAAGSWEELLRQTFAAEREMLPHRRYPIAELQRLSGGNPLFEAVFNYVHFHVYQDLTGVEEIEYLGGQSFERTNFAFVVSFGQDPFTSQLQMRAEYDTAELLPAEIETIMARYLRALEALAGDAAARWEEMSWLTAAERHQALLEWNDTEKPCPQLPMIHELVALHARRRPEAVAVDGVAGRLTYGELDARANRLAHYLRRSGVGPEVLVALCTERTPERVIGILAVLKAGGAYVSLDPTHPVDRLAFLLEDARAPVLLTQSPFLKVLPETSAQVICLDDDRLSSSGDESWALSAPDSGVAPGNLAYVVYTSGSTGRPKGVEIPHAGLMNLVRWHQDLYGVTPDDRGTQIASPAFDASVWELLPYLSAGASVHVPSEETRLSSSGMIRWWSEQGITLAYLMTPLAEGVLEEKLPAGLDLKVRALIIGGDRLHRRPDPEVGFKLMNHYGPAEYTVTSTVVQVQPQGQPQGRPQGRREREASETAASWDQPSETHLPAPPPLTEAERQQMLVEWNDTRAPHPLERPIHELFELQAARTPELAAVRLAGDGMSYGELDRRSNQLAHRLRRLGVRPEVRVAICLARGLDLAVALLGVLKAGGAYVPLDADYPQERLAFMLSDSGAAVLLTEEALRTALPEHAAAVVSVDAERASIARESAAPVASGATPENLAYVIYTSGSTATPKGVLIPHRAFVNHNVASAGYYEVGPGDRFLQFASISFDIAGEEFFIPWLTGATVVLNADPAGTSFEQYLELVARQELTILNLPSSFWHDWVAQLSRAPRPLPPSLRVIIVGNEKALPERFAAWRRLIGSRVRSTNAYGPAEDTVTTTIYEPALGPEEEALSTVPIGRPIDNKRVYMLDDEMRPVPVGAPGELYVGGAGLARGYLGRPDLTVEKFVPNPFAGDPWDAPGSRLYRTGDLARYLPDGNIEFLGRVDHQVKIRGFRIELDEVETVLRRHPEVGSAVVLAREDQPGDRRLVAYLVGESGPVTASVPELRRHVRERLPEHMVPSAFVALAAWPLTPNGKLDRKALPAPEVARPSAESSPVAPGTPAGEPLPGQASGIPTIGRPVDNTQIYLLDRRLRPVPIGVRGELFVAGLGTARGYLHRPELTAEKFIPDPFSAEPGARMYRTADLVRYLPDGDMDFLGRLDYQVKIRGLRIELGEIESVLGQHPGVREAAVLVHEARRGDGRLTAYVVAAQGLEPAAGADELRAFLKDRLPEYMIPKTFLFMAALPMSPNGKIDRRALPVPEAATQEYVAPRNRTEEVLAGIWAEVLRVEAVGIHDNFFDLGGHSLLATRIMSQLREALGVDVPLRTLFERSTVAELADAVEQQAGAQAGPQQELQTIAETLAQLDKLSPEEIAILLQQRLQ